MPQETNDERALLLLSQEQPCLSVAVLTYNLEAFEFYCHMNRSDPSKPFPVLQVGNRLSIQPTVKQLAQLRDEITAFLETEGASPARTDTETGVNLESNTKKDRS